MREMQLLQPQNNNNNNNSLGSDTNGTASSEEGSCSPHSTGSPPPPGAAGEWGRGGVVHLAWVINEVFKGHGGLCFPVYKCFFLGSVVYQ